MGLLIRACAHGRLRINKASSGFLLSEHFYEAMNQTIVILLFATSLVDVSQAQSGSGSLCYGTACDYKNCTTDYFTLERAVLDNHDNVFKLTTTFFPSHKNNPLYLTVTYSSPSTSAEYVWSTATMYHIIHPRIIRYLSLLFCYVEDERIDDLELEIPEECSNLTLNKKSDNTNFLHILTQRVRFLLYISIYSHYIHPSRLDHAY